MPTGANEVATRKCTVHPLSKITSFFIAMTGEPALYVPGIILGVITGLIVVGVLFLYVHQWRVNRAAASADGRAGVTVASRSLSEQPASTSTNSGGFENEVYEQ